MAVKEVPQQGENETAHHRPRIVQVIEDLFRGQQQPRRTATTGEGEKKELEHEQGHAEKHRIQDRRLESIDALFEDRSAHHVIVLPAHQKPVLDAGWASSP